MRPAEVPNEVLRVLRVLRVLTVLKVRVLMVSAPSAPLGPLASLAPYLVSGMTRNDTGLPIAVNASPVTVPIVAV
jgi:hypothetical protein